ncbi:hypothetical protein ACP275_06G174800 [Erythranthe tilingii]
MSGGRNRSPITPSKNSLPPQELIDDLCSRLVVNTPKEDQRSFERLLFLVESAHWFYEDNAVENDPSLKSLTLKQFTYLLFNNCEVLKPYVPYLDDIFKDFTAYKFRVPVAGAIILDETYERCLLVKGWKGNSWSFPRGKKCKDEEDHNCAIREVLEETGFDVSELLNEDEYIEMYFGQQRARLYIISGVNDQTPFAPLCKKEISEIAWKRLNELEPANDNGISRGITGLKLYMVSPFLASLKSWISVHPPPVAPKPYKPRKGFSVWNVKNIEKQPSKAVINNARRPIRSFLNFRLDIVKILKAVDYAFFSS